MFGNNLRQDNLGLAIGSILFAVFVLSFGDAVIKRLSISFPLWQIYVIRSLIALPILITLIKVDRSKPNLIPETIFWTAIRSLLLACMWVAFYAALPHIKLSVAAAVYYTIPLFITLFSALFTGDNVGRKSWFAIALGFAGVLIILRPDSDEFNRYALLPLIAAVFYALAMILTRTKCFEENPKVLSLSLNFAFIAMGCTATILIAIWGPSEQLIQTNSFLLGDWTPLNTKGWMSMGILGIVIIVGSLFSAIAYQNGPSSMIASFDYCYLAFSAMWGIILLSEIPDGVTIIGMLLIAGAGLIAIRSE